MRGRQLERAAGASALLPLMPPGEIGSLPVQNQRSSVSRLVRPSRGSSKGNATRRLVPSGRLNLRECRDRSEGGARDRVAETLARSGGYESPAASGWLLQVIFGTLAVR